jgi:chromate transport protein ChrA
VSERHGRRSVSFAEALRFWFKLGWISFGGPAGQIAVMHRQIVERRRWLGEGRFLHAQEYFFFTKAAFVTFGGAYAVLAYVTQAVDRLALAETTPGPLIMVLQFVGFMAAWNHLSEHGIN